MSTVRRGLGSGISALLGDMESVLNTEDSFGLRQINIDKILVNPNQPRKTFDDNSLKQLAESIKIYGVLQPILVAQENENFIIIAGERRYRASKISGLRFIPAIILKNRNAEDRYKLAILENIQRENLNPIEEAQAYQFLIENFGYTHENIAEKVSKSRSYITNSLRILKLPHEVLLKISEGEISSGHAKILSGMKEEAIKEAIEYIENDKMSVRALENYVKNKKNKLNGIPKEVTLSDKLRKKITGMINHSDSQFMRNETLLEIAQGLSDITGYTTQLTDNGRNIFMNIEIGSVADLAKMVDAILKDFDVS